MPTDECQRSMQPIVSCRARRAASASRFSIQHSEFCIRNAFTLIELLIVLAIISLVVALGIPLFGVLTGSKSVEAGRNIVAATIGSARTIAVNEGKYAGVIFYIDPATERTAMSVVVVSDPNSGLEDPDPYDRYKSWVGGADSQQYRAPEIDSGGNPTRGDRVIGLAVDADATFKGVDYPKSPQPSTYMQLFGNYRPVVRTYRCTETHDSAQNNRPPHNGPYGNYPGSIGVPAHAETLPGQTSTAAPGNKESVQGPFANEWWDGTADRALTRYSGEQSLLPKGIGVQVIVQPLATDSTTSERYLRTAVIMFDPQGRLVQQSFALPKKDTLAQYLGLTNNAQDIPSGIGIVLYDATSFRDKQFSDSDWYYQARTNNYAVISTTVVNKAFNDFVTTPTSKFDVGSATDERSEEVWLDNKTTPLLINRFSGALSATD